MNEEKTNMNGKQATSLMIRLFVWILNTMPSMAIGSMVNALGLVSKKCTVEALEELLYGGQYHNHSTKMFTDDGTKAMILTSKYQDALNGLPFKSVTSCITFYPFKFNSEVWFNTIIMAIRIITFNKFFITRF